MPLVIHFSHEGLYQKLTITLGMLLNLFFLIFVIFSILFCNLMHDFMTYDFLAPGAYLDLRRYFTLPAEIHCLVLDSNLRNIFLRRTVDEQRPFPCLIDQDGRPRTQLSPRGFQLGRSYTWLRWRLPSGLEARCLINRLNANRYNHPVGVSRNR